MKTAVPPKINYLRLSITDRCNLRCFYCNYWQEGDKLPAPEILRYEELLRVASLAAEMGLRKVRVTGGEPLIRRGVVDFLHKLHKIPGLEEICLTTNGVLLPDLAPALYEAGLRRLNVSLDTLRRDRYRKITGRDNFLEVTAGLHRAVSLGFHPVKINCVVLKGLNDDELLDLALLAREHPYQVRFIELMPTGSPDQWQRHFLPMAEVRRHLSMLGTPEPVAPEATAGPARICRFPGFKGEVGFISPMSGHQCLACNRLRLTAAGKLRPCLLKESELDLKGPIRQGASDHFLSYLFQQAVDLKVGGPPYPLEELPPLYCSMASIGG